MPLSLSLSARVREEDRKDTQTVGGGGERNMLAKGDRERQKEREIKRGIEGESKNTFHALENPETRQMERGTNCVTGKK